jgi:predicted nucleic acid-binding protein
VERKPLSVLDASVILKWFIEENYSDKARKIQDDYLAGKINLIVPDLLLYEVSNALRFNRSFSESDIKQVLDSLSELRLDVFPVNYELAKSAVKISYNFKLTVYDAIYVSLAIETKSDFITADKEMFEKLQKIPSVKWLGSY